jgi:hypothetical protein
MKPTEVSDIPGRVMDEAGLNSIKSAFHVSLILYQLNLKGDIFNDNVEKLNGNNAEDSNHRDPNNMSFRSKIEQWKRTIAHITSIKNATAKYVILLMFDVLLK